MADMLNPHDLERVVVLIEDISRDVERLSVKFTGSADKIKKTIEDTTLDVKKKTTKTIDEIERRYDDFDKFSIARIHLFGRETEMTLDRLEKKWQEYGRQARGPLGAAGSGIGITSIGNGISSLKNQMFAGMPGGMGGLLGMALWGGLRNEEFAAAARRTLYQLQAVGQTGSAQIGLLTGQTRTLYKLMGSMGEELDAVQGAFTQFSLGTEVFEQANVHAGGLWKSIQGTSLAFDLLNAAAPGTAARLIGEQMMNASVSTKEAANQVFALAGALRDAKLNYSAFSQGIVQANSAMRMQNQSLDDTRRLFFSLKGAFEKQGMGPQRAAQMALSGLQGAMGAVGGLQPGLQGEIARRMANSGAAGFAGINDPVARMMQLRLGMKQEGPMATQIFDQLRDIATKAAGSSGNSDERRLKSIYALSQIGGMSDEAARAIIDGARATELLKPASDRTATSAESLNQAFHTYAGKQSEFERMLRQAQDEMAQVGSSILGVLVGTMQMLPVLFEKLALDIKDATKIGGLGPEEKKRQQALGVAATGLAGVATSSQDEIFDHLSNILNIGKNAGGKLSSNARTKAILDKLKATEPKVYKGESEDPIEKAATAQARAVGIDRRNKKAAAGGQAPLTEPLRLVAPSENEISDAAALLRRAANKLDGPRRPLEGSAAPR